MTLIYQFDWKNYHPIKIKEIIIDLVIKKKIDPNDFTLTELQNVISYYLDKDLDKRNFRVMIKRMGMIQEIEGEFRKGPHRPAQIYKFTFIEGPIIE